MNVLDEVPENPCEAVEFITLRLFDGKADYYDPPAIRQEKRFELITLIEILDESCAACDDYAAFAETTAYLADISSEVVRQNRYAIVLSELEPLAQEIYRVTTARQARTFRGTRKRRPAEIELRAMAELAAEIRVVLNDGVVGIQTERELVGPLRKLESALRDKTVTNRTIRTEAEAIARICTKTGPRARPIAERIAKLARILSDEPLTPDLPGNGG